MSSDKGIEVLRFLRRRGELGAATEELADALGIPVHPNPRRRFYYFLNRMVEKKEIRREPQGKRLWRYFAT